MTTTPTFADSTLALPQIARVEDLSDSFNIASIRQIRHFVCPQDSEAWSGKPNCPKCGSEGELYKTSDRETRNTLALFSPILDQFDDLEDYASVYGWNLKTVLENVIELVKDGIFIDPDLHDELRRLAKKRDTSVNDALNEAIRDHIDMWS